MFRLFEKLKKLFYCKKQNLLITLITFFLEKGKSIPYHYFFLRIFYKNSYFKQTTGFCKVFLISMLLILGWASFWMNYWINVAWHGGHLPGDLLRCNGSPGFWDSSLHVIYIFGLMILIYFQCDLRLLVIKPNNTMIIELPFSTFAVPGPAGSLNQLL